MGSKNFINQEGRFLTNSLFKLVYVPSPLNTTEITHNEEQFSCEGEYNLWQSDDKLHNLGIYKLSTVDKQLSMNTSCQFLYNYGTMILLNAGIRNLGIKGTSSGPVNFCTFSSPSLSLGGLYRLYSDANNTSWTGVHLNFNKDQIQQVKSLVGYDSSNFSGIIQVILTKTLLGKVQTEIDRKSEVGNITLVNKQTIQQESYSHDIETSLGFTSKISDEMNFFTLLKNNGMDLMNTFIVVGGIYNIDKNTSYRFKIQSDYSFGFGFVRRFSNLMDMSFSTNFKQIQIDGKNFLTSKFGLSLNLIED